MPWEASTDEYVLAEARAEILASCDGELPKILDPFAGGGAIPLEALRLGLPTYAGDLNPVAVLIQRAMLEIPHRFANRPPVHPTSHNKLSLRDKKGSESKWNGAHGLAADVRGYGEWMRERAWERIGEHYPDAVLPDGTTATPIAWIWARTVQSPDPSWPGHVPLVRSWVLAKKQGKPTVWIEPIVDRELKTIRYEIREGGTPLEGNVDRGNATCIATGASMDANYVKAEGIASRMGIQMLAVVGERPAGRVYLRPQGLAGTPPNPPWVPTGGMSDHSQYMGTPRYGLDEWQKLFTARQLVALTTFSDLLGEVRAEIERDAVAAGLSAGGERLRDGGRGAAAYADAVVTYLAFAVDRLADRNSTVCGWDVSRGHARNTFARQAIPMTWDFAENNPLGDSSGCWSNMVSGIANAIGNLPCGAEGASAQRDARARIAEIGTCVLSTDPPYYDNVPYSDISDFFYVWLRRNLGDVWPDECATLLTPKAEELIANQYRAGSKAAALKHFESGMFDVFGEAAANVDPRFPVTIFYAFKAADMTSEGRTSTGWETFLSGLLDAGFAITSTWPMRTEMGNRMRAIDSGALASSIVLACRPRAVDASLASRGEFVAALRLELGPAVGVMQAENIAPVDLAQAAMGPGMAIYSRYGRVVEADGSTMSVRAALGLINESLGEILSGEESEMDTDSRFALTWFEQYGHNPGPFGDADTLARAKDTTVAGVAEAGIAVSRDGKVRLLERSELSDLWDPHVDARLTVWEMTQHLIRALLSSEVEAAGLLALIGPDLGERARQLAYLLYKVCDDKRWADEAGAYNMLVMAWPEISRLAAAETTDGQMF